MDEMDGQPEGVASVTRRGWSGRSCRRAESVLAGLRCNGMRGKREVRGFKQARERQRDERVLGGGQMAMNSRRARSSPPVPRIGLTRTQAAESLSVSLDTFERYIQPQLRIVRLGRTRIVPQHELERWVKENAESAEEGLISPRRLA